MMEEQCLHQLEEGLVENFESSDIGAVVCLWEKKEAMPLLLTEETVEEHKENNLPLPPTDSVNILPSPTSQSQPKTLEAPNTKATPITAYSKKLQEISGHCTEFCHYLKEDGSCTYRMA